MIALVACAVPTPIATPVTLTTVPPMPGAILITPPPAPIVIPASSTLTVGRVVEPEVQATKSGDVLGVWLVVYSPSGRFASSENHWEHTADGARVATGITGSMQVCTKSNTLKVPERQIPPPLAHTKSM
jgi:hypothetical protein